MSQFSLVALSAAAALLAAASSVSAGDLGDGGYGPRVYGQQPYYSGQGEDPGSNYSNRGDDDDDNANDDDDHASTRDEDNDDDDADNDNDNDDDSNNTGEHHPERHSYRHEGSVREGYPPVPSANVYSHRDRAGACVPGWRVKQRLTGEGWSNFHLNNYGRGVAVIRATRVHTGRPFVLRIDGCTGNTLSSVPAGQRQLSDGGYDERRHSSRN